MKTVGVGAWASLITLLGSAFATILSAQTPCTFAISPSSGSHSAGASTGLVSVTTSDGCAWSVANTNGWISLLSGSNGIGNGIVSYQVSPNHSAGPNPNVPASDRVGYLLIGDQSFAVAQQGAACSFAFSPGSATLEHAASTNFISVTTSPDCSWTAINPGQKPIDFIKILSDANNTGSGTVVYSVPDLPATYWRTGFILIGGHMFTITQKGISCDFSISATNRSYGAAATNDTVDVSSATICSWEVSMTNDWITILSGPRGTGPGSVAFALTANPGPDQRIGEIYIAGQFSFRVTQAADPEIVSQPAHQVVPPGGTAFFSVEVEGTGPFTYQWYFGSTPLTDGNGISGATTSVLMLTDVQTSQAGVYWVTVSNSLRGFSSLAASLTVSCGYTLFPHTANVSSISNTDFIVVNGTTNCPWNFVNTNSWITILSGLTDIGSGTIVYSVAQNPTTNGRSGKLFIADHTFIVNQAGSAPTDAAVSLDEALDTVGILPWGTTSTPAWFGQTLVSHDGVDAAQSGPVGDGGAVTIQTTVSGPGTISFWWKVSSELKDYLKFFINGVQQIRISGEVDWQLRSLPITSPTNILKWTYSKSPGLSWGLDHGWLDQVRFLPGTGCVVTLSQTNAAHSWNSETGQVSVAAAGGCAWAVDNPNSWITPLTDVAEGDGYFRYIVSATDSAASRSGVVLIGGQPFTIAQQGAPCAYSISPTSQSHNYLSATRSFTVNTLVGCPWSVVNTNDWITILSGMSGSSSSLVNYSIAENTNSFPRSGNLLVGDQLFFVYQTGAIPLREALDTESTTLEWFYGASVGFNEDWIGQSAVTHDGVDAMQSGDVIPNGSSSYGSFSYIGTTMWVPGTFTFWWKVSSGSTNGGLHFFIDQVELVAIVNEVDWQQQTIAIPGGQHTLYWDYFDTSPDGGSGHAWVDQVQFIPSPPCPVTLSFNPDPAPSTISTGIVSVAAASECAWSVLNTNTWITINTGATGSGNGLVRYTVAANPAFGPRSGSLFIGDQTILITQLGGGTGICSYALSPTNRAHGYASASNFVTVTTQEGCPWSAFNTNSWITITSSNDFTGPGIVRYTVDANPSTSVRSGNIIIAGRTFTVTQFGSPAGCAITLTPTSRTHDWQTATGTVAVATQAGCGWNVFSSNSWVSILSSLNNAGSGTVIYSVAPNPNSQTRRGNIIIAGQQFLLTQLGTSSATNAPRLQLMSQTPTNTTLSVQGNAGKVYVVECSDDLIHWTPISTNSTPSTVTDAPVANAPRRFYRTVEIP